MRWKLNKSACGPIALCIHIFLCMSAAEGAHVQKRATSSCKLTNINWDTESQSAQCTNEEASINEPCSSREDWPEQTVAEIRCNDFWRSTSNPDSKVTNICLNGKWEEEPTDKNLKCEVICGVAGESAFDSLHLQSRSEHANQRKRSPLLKGNWPWHVGIYTEDIPGSGDFRYSCGGTLISTRAILTAAQCVTYRQQPALELQPSMVKIATGSFKLLYGERVNETIEPVEKIVLNAQYNHTVYGADLAIIWLHDHLSISPYVHPICLPREDQDEEEIKLNELGKLVVLRNRTFEETHVPTMDLQKCRESSTTHSLLAHPTSLCTRSNNDPAVCMHTAGVGLAFENPVDRTKPSHIITRWTIQGVRSGVLYLNQDCGKPIIFSKVSKFVQWINNELKNREPPIFPKIIAATATSEAPTSTTTTLTSSTAQTGSRATATPQQKPGPVPESESEQTTLRTVQTSTKPRHSNKTDQVSPTTPFQLATDARMTTQMPSSVSNSAINTFSPQNSGSSGEANGPGPGTVRTTSKKPVHTNIQTNTNRPKIEQDYTEENLQHFNGLSVQDSNYLKYRNRISSPSSSSGESTPSFSNIAPTIQPQQMSPVQSDRDRDRNRPRPTVTATTIPTPTPTVTVLSSSVKNSDDKETELHATQLEDWEKDVGIGDVRSNPKTTSGPKRIHSDLEVSFASSTIKSNLFAAQAPSFSGSGSINSRERVETNQNHSHSTSGQGLGLKDRQRQGQGQGPSYLTPTTGVSVNPEPFPSQSISHNNNPDNIRWPLVANDDEDDVGLGFEALSVKNPLRSLMCPMIRASEGVKLQCRHDRFEDADNCVMGGWPGSRATYTCDKFYKSVYGTISVQQNCTERGSWFPSRDFGCKIECGISSRPKISYIVNGVISDRVSWPWHATIFKRNAESGRLIYHCGGTLISKSVVITAAHCLTYPRTTDTINEEFVILLAAISSNFTLNRFDAHTRKYRVKKIFVPETYNPLTFESDIALIQFEEDVKLSDYVKPICWPSKNNIEYSNLESVHLEHGSRGYTVGFGIDETGELGYELKETALPYVTHKDCRAALDRLPTSTQFCAGYRNGTAVCNGDSGGGIYFLDDSNTAKRFILQGIISNGDPKENSKFCNSNNYAVFTKVSSFSSWIEPILDIINEERRYGQTESESEILLPIPPQ